MGAVLGGFVRRFQGVCFLACGQECVGGHADLIHSGLIGRACGVILVDGGVIGCLFLRAFIADGRDLLDVAQHIRAYWPTGQPV